jgi:hypothetical protein
VAHAVDAQLGQPRMGDRLSGDLVADGLHVAQLVPRQVAGLVDQAAVDVERAVHPVPGQQRQGANLVRGCHVELERDDRPRAGGGLGRGGRRHGERRGGDQRGCR